MIFFTLCSNNYLAQAKILGDSLKKFNPDYHFIIGLTDELHPDIDYSFFKNLTVLPVAEIGINDFDSLWKKYNIIEFNTCVKASFFKYLFKTYPNEQCVCFLDPDIAIYHSLAILETELEQNNILLTPHIYTPIPIDGKRPTENLFLNYGIYNLGFIAINRDCFSNSKFLDWWEERTLTIGFDQPRDGIFVDQLWINFVPLFFEKVKILSSYGFNAAPWNLHERTVEESSTGILKMNDGHPLYFFHFSNFKFSEPDKISNSPTYNRYNFATQFQLKPLYSEYCKQLIINRVVTLSTIGWAYIKHKQNYNKEQASKKNKLQSFLNMSKNAFKQVLPPVVVRLVKLVVR